MAASSTKIRLKPKPTDVWSLREKLALACAVVKSGDQNWVSVSRTVKPFGELHRPQEWFSQKNCALQYSELLEKWDIPKRKRAERGDTETTGTYIVKRLSVDRTEELKKLIHEKQERYKVLTQEIEFIKSGAQDDKLKEIWEEMCKQKAAEEQAIAKLAEEAQKTPSSTAKPLLQAKLNRPPHGLKLKMGESVQADNKTEVPQADTVIKVEDEPMDVQEVVPAPKAEVSIVSTPVPTPQPSAVQEKLQPKEAVVVEVQDPKLVPTPKVQTPTKLLSPVKVTPEIKVEPMEVKEEVVVTEVAAQEVVAAVKTPPAAAVPAVRQAAASVKKETPSPVTASRFRTTRE